MRDALKAMQNTAITDGSFDAESAVRADEKNYGEKSGEVPQMNGANFEQSPHFQHVLERENREARIKEKIENWIRELKPQEKVSLDDFNWDNLSKPERVRLIATLVSMAYPVLTPNLATIIAGSFYCGDCGRNPDDRPEWLEMDKFLRGQKFAREHYFGISFAQLLSLFTLFSFDHGLRPLILTGKSSTPYTSFKRYLSTDTRVQNWYRHNPWERGTPAYKDIQTVRKLHSLIRQQLSQSTTEAVRKATKIKNPISPSRELLLEDLRSTCPAPMPGQCIYALLDQHTDVLNLGIEALNQAEMSSTQFGFFGLVILFPEAFGIHNASEEDLEAFCHTWRGLGYLLGIDDEFNLCQGTLAEIKQRCYDFLHIWVKPNFREITPEWEHMMRCVIEGVHYYFPGSSYETSFLYLAELMGLKMPRLYNSLSFVDWIRYKVLRSFFYYTARIPGVVPFFNKRLDMFKNIALNFSPKHLAKLEERSNETMKKFEVNAQKCSKEANLEKVAKEDHIITHV